MANRIFTSKDYEKLKKNVSIANQRIARLTNKYGERSWAVSGLYDKLEDVKVLGLTKTGYIKLNKNMSDIKLKYISKAVEDFINPEKTKTSTIRGAEKVIKETKQSIKEHYSDMGNKISDNDAGKLYNILEDRNLRDMSETFDPSETWARMIRAKEQNLSFDKFANLFKNDADIKDVDVRDYLKEIYDLYMK